MSHIIEFMEFASQNDDAHNELEALRLDLEGLSEQEYFDAIVKAAAKYGFTLTAEDFTPKMEELSEDELKAVAGGKCVVAGCEWEAAGELGLACGMIAPWFAF